jgi:hypothetical protein
MAYQHDPDGALKGISTRGPRSSMEGAAMFIVYRGFEVVPVKDGEKWQAQIFSGGKRITTTPPAAAEEPAMTEAKKIVDEIRSS